MNKAKNTLLWIGGVMFILAAIGSLKYYILAGLLYFLLGIFLLPITQKFLITKGFSISNKTKWIIGIILLILASSLSHKEKNKQVETEIKNNTQTILHAQVVDEKTTIIQTIIKQDGKYSVNPSFKNAGQ